MLYTPPRSTFHHTVLSGLFRPISFVLVHVVISLSTALFALYRSNGPAAVDDWVASFWYDRSSVMMYYDYWYAYLGVSNTFSNINLTYFKTVSLKHKTDDMIDLLVNWLELFADLARNGRHENCLQNTLLFLTGCG